MKKSFKRDTMSSNSKRRRKNQKPESEEIANPTENNEEEDSSTNIVEDQEGEEADTSSKESDNSDSSPDSKNQKSKNNITSESNDQDSNIRTSNRIKRSNRSSENLSNSANKSKSRKNPSSSQNETETNKESGKPNDIKILISLLEQLKSSVINLECEYDAAAIATYIIEDFLFNGQVTLDNIINCFSLFYDEYKRFLDGVYLNSAFNELYEYVRDLEIISLQFSNEDPLFSPIREFVEKINELISPIKSLEPFERLIILIRQISEATIGTYLEELIANIHSKIIPIALLANSVSMTNYFIRQISSIEKFQSVSIEIIEYGKYIELQEYESTINNYHPNPYYVEHCQNLVSYLEKEGLQITSSTIIADNNCLVQIVPPNIHNELTSLKINLESLAEIQNDESLKTLSEDISQPTTLTQLFTLEKEIVVKNHQSPSEIQESVLKVLKLLRVLHSLFLILDSEKLISYSNAVHLTYFRTYATEISQENVLANQSLLCPIDKDLLVQIALKTTQKINPAMVSQRDQLRVWMKFTSIDVFSKAFEDDDMNDAYLQWFTFLATVDPETKSRTQIIESMNQIPPIHDYNDTVLSYLTEVPYVQPTNSSSFVHLEYFFQKQLSDTCINYQSSLINSIRTSNYMKQYKKMLQMSVDDGFITLPEGFTMTDDIKGFNEHHWGLHFKDLLPFLYEVSDLLPELTEETIDLHISFSMLHSGKLSYENVANFCQLSLKHRKGFYNPQQFVNLITKLSRFVLFVDFHDQIVIGHAAANELPLSMMRTINARILCRTIANQILILNTSSAFDPTRSKEIAVEAVLLRMIADAITPSIRTSLKVRERFLNCLSKIKGFFDSSFYGLHGLINQISINISLSKIENDNMKELAQQVLSYMNDLEISIRPNDYVGAPSNMFILTYFELQKVLHKIEDEFPSEKPSIEFIQSSIKMITIIAQIRETIITAMKPEAEFKCIFPVSIRDKMGQNVPIISSTQAHLVNKSHFPIPDKPLSISKQNEMIKLFQHLSSERDKLIQDISLLQTFSEKNQKLQRKIEQLFEVRKKRLDEFHANKAQLNNLYARLAKRNTQAEETSLIADGIKVTPKELVIDIEKHRNISALIESNIDQIKTKLSSYSSRLKTSSNEIKRIEQDIIDLRIQQSIVRENNQNEMRMMALMDKPKEEVKPDPIDPGPDSTEIDPSLKSIFPDWLHVPDKAFKKIKHDVKFASGLSDSHKVEMEAISDESETDKLAREIKVLRERRDVLHAYIKKSKEELKNLLAFL